MVVTPTADAQRVARDAAGVYYAAAAAFVHGRLPYRDFLFLQPPGIVVLLSPFAWLGRVTTDSLGLAVGRLSFMTVGGLNAGLVTALLRRYGWAAATVGGLFYALLYPAAYSERSTLLEPLGTCGLLLALLILGATADSSRNWSLLAGASLGITLSVKLWYVLPLLVVVAFHRKRAGRVVAGAIVTGLAVCVPFFVCAPATMFRQVVVDQLGRPRSAITIFGRLGKILGDPRLGSGPDSVLRAVVEAALLVVVAALVLAAARRRGPRVFAALFLANSAVLLAAPSFFLHYAAFTAAPLALLVGMGAGRVAAVVPGRRLRGMVVVTAVAVTVVLNVEGDRTGVGERIPGALRLAAARVPGCVVADDPTILPVMNVLSRDLSHGCRLWPDVTGWTYDLDNVRVRGVELSRPGNAAWQHHVLAYLGSGAAEIAFRPATGLSARSRSLLRRGRVLARDGRWVLRSSWAGG